MKHCAILPTGLETDGAAFSIVPRHYGTANAYDNVVIQLDRRRRVIICKKDLQWIVHKRSAEPLHRGKWRAKSYITIRKALIRLCASLELLSDASVRARLEALPEQFSGYSKK